MALQWQPSPLLRRFENVCVHIAYKGSMNRQAYAWFPGEGGADRVPNPPLFSRHVEFLRSESEFPNVQTWWKQEDINRTVGRRGAGPRIKVTASDLKTPRNYSASARWIPGASWFLDFSHGGTPNLWRNICHFSNSMFPFFEAAHKGQACKQPLSNVFLWQVSYDASLLGNQSYHGGMLGAILEEQRKVWSVSNGDAPKEKVRFWFDEDLFAGDTLCFHEVVVVEETNSQHRKLQLQTRASMTTAGVARGFGGDASVRWGFRRAILAHLRVHVPGPRIPTITYLSRPMGRDAKLHGRAWQLRCHVTQDVFRKLRARIFKESGYDVVRVVFERTTYAYQAEVISNTDILWAAHGAGMVHMPLLPRLAAMVEMFNCGHFSYLYANLALNLGIKYFTMQRLEPYCYQPQSLWGDTRKNISKTYAYQLHEVMPVLMQAIRYHIWQDPSPSLTGREPKCLFARKTVGATGSLPTGMSFRKYKTECEPGFGNDEAAKRHRRISSFWRSKVEPPEGNGQPGMFTRWAGLG